MFRRRPLLRSRVRRWRQGKPVCCRRTWGKEKKVAPPTSSRFGLSESWTTIVPVARSKCYTQLIYMSFEEIFDVEGPRRPYHDPICFFFLRFFEKSSLFRSSYTFSSIITAWETRLTENGKVYIPNRTCVGARLIPQIEAYIHPYLTVPPVNRSKTRIVVFASRKAIPEF